MKEDKPKAATTATAPKANDTSKDEKPKAQTAAPAHAHKAEDKPKAEKKAFKLKPVHVIVPVVIVALLAGTYFVVTNSAQSVVAVGDNVSVYYTGSFTNGTVFSTNVGGQPLNFTVGAGQLIKGFDQGVVGMSVGQNKTLTLPPSEAYGAVNQSLIEQIPTVDFGNQTPSIGQLVESSQGQEGEVIASGDNTVTVDFNPPLAGQTLVFRIEVVKISK